MAVLLIAAGAAACGSNDVQSGMIVAKSTQAAHTYQEQDCRLYGKYSCVWWDTVTKTEPPHWYLALQDPNDPRHITARDVTPQQYARYQEGQRYP